MDHVAHDERNEWVLVKSYLIGGAVVICMILGFILLLVPPEILEVL